MLLENKVCLIAGGSGTLGLAVAKRFQNEGASVVITYHSQNPLTHGWQPGAGERESLALRLDIRDHQQVQDVVQRVISRFGTIHVLVNCTGVLGPVGATSEVPADEWAQAVEINLIGSFYLTRAVLPAMLAQLGGKIIHFSGGGAAYGRPFYTAYSSSKAALVRFSESLADELRETHIDVNTIAPGPVNSRMWEQVRAVKQPDSKTVAELRKMDETGGVPADRAAELALFLASDRSNGLTGRLISAIWDKWDTFHDRIEEIMGSEAGTLRRLPLE